MASAGIIECQVLIIMFKYTDYVQLRTFTPLYFPSFLPNIKPETGFTGYSVKQKIAN